MALQTHFAALVRWRQDQEYYWNNMHTIKVIHRENIDHCQTEINHYRNHAYMPKCRWYVQ